MSTLGVESYEGHRTQMRSQDRTDQVDNESPKQPTRWPAARQSATDVNGRASATRRVEFEGVKDRDTRGGTPRQLATISCGTCDCDDADVDTTYRMCCITVGTSPSFKAATLFEMAHMSIGK